ncbi:hypothetical protein GBA52_013223 [Prunus armeniaca]|nr:hypothetical protein GBA52_013223 [Prunus armeniaca]
MEALTADRHIPNTAAFPEQIAPFPESTDQHLLFANPTAVVHSPPQKLRPIRCSSGRCPAIELPDSAGNLGDGGPAHVGSGTWGDEGENESSSSPDDDGDEYLKTEGTERMKRKRKRRSRTGGRLERVEIFLESLVMKVMEKQEQMHKQLIEMIENREKERIAREEAWKQQELDRMKRDEEIRAQETSRSLTLISFIQNFLGHEIQVPKPAPPPPPPPISVVPNYDHRCMDENGGADNGIERDMMVMIKCDQTNRRWPEAEVQSLITLRAGLEHKFRIAGNSKGPIWEEISLGMYDMGYNRSARKCKEKWENINKYFKRSMGTDKKRSANAKTCPYFHELELLHKSGLVSSEDGFKCTSNQNEAKIEKQDNSEKGVTE